jgi:glycine dehydrogenase
MLLIFAEYEKVQAGEWSSDNNPLHNAPHTLGVVTSDRPLAYSRQVAVCPDPAEDYRVKYFPPVGRVDNVYGDRNLVCSCPPVSAYEETTQPELAGAR